METYTVRDKDGTMIARLVGTPAENIFKNLDGNWRTYKAKGEKRTVCYEIERDCVWESETPKGAFQLYFWKGTILIKD